MTHLQGHGRDWKNKKTCYDCFPVLHASHLLVFVRCFDIAILKWLSSYAKKISLPCSMCQRNLLHASQVIFKNYLSLKTMSVIGILISSYSIEKLWFWHFVGKFVPQNPQFLALCLGGFVCRIMFDFMRAVCGSGFVKSWLNCLTWQLCHCICLLLCVNVAWVLQLDLELCS